MFSLNISKIKHDEFVKNFINGVISNECEKSLLNNMLKNIGFLPAVKMTNLPK